ncbi:hypothetical protein CgunFtcFv8_007128 [Champsocephalus gunnari]|uniref:Secreted protein n=1 Tax=Champsocephalus gunnari TaxID=52237 RepID=A0AAN8H5Y1_CHAGU|nr:hypothetical protein CgunFtcFv8_007128 [Champsocephalus gunnari]
MHSIPPTPPPLLLLLLLLLPPPTPQRHSNSRQEGRQRGRGTVQEWKEKEEWEGRSLKEEDWENAGA